MPARLCDGWLAMPDGTDRRVGRRLACVTYHHFAATPCAATARLGITTSPQRFAAQLDYFARRYAVIGLDQVLAGDIPERALLITIDDAYRSVHEVAAPMLASRRLPAVMFANPAPIRRPFVPLDNLLALAVSHHSPGALGAALAPAGLAATALARVVAGASSGLTLAEMDRVRAAVLAFLRLDEAGLHRDCGLFLSPSHIAELPGMGVEIANHTMRHTSCRHLEPSELQVEIVEAKAELEAMSGRPVRAFAFPWGNEGDATPGAMAAVRTSGHAATFLMHGRCNGRRPATDVWYRSLVQNETGLGLAMSVELLPRLRSIRQAALGMVRRPPPLPAG